MSTFPSSGRFGGHWLGDNTARWEDLQTSVVVIIIVNYVHHHDQFLNVQCISYHLLCLLNPFGKYYQNSSQNQFLGFKKVCFKVLATNIKVIFNVESNIKWELKNKGYLYWDAGDDLFDNIEVHKSFPTHKLDENTLYILRTIIPNGHFAFSSLRSSNILTISNDGI
uniref:Plastocyanin-like domain-containing protein n=1 Tax=Heterorhabditis bacteriophora TaxID=37862 RepID=A0A1I7W749_HETBA